MSLSRLVELRRRAAASRVAASTYFLGVLAILALLSTVVSGCAVALVGFLAYFAPAPFMWPLLDAIAARYNSEPTFSAPARSRLPWVWAVLVGMLIASLVGAFSDCGAP